MMCSWRFLPAWEQKITWSTPHSSYRAQVLADLVGRADRAAQPADALLDDLGAEPVFVLRPRPHRFGVVALLGAALPGTRPTRRCARAGAGRTRSSARASSRRSSRPRCPRRSASSSSSWHMNVVTHARLRVDRVADRHAFASRASRSSRRPSTAPLRDRRTRTRARRCRSARRGGSCRAGCTRPTAAGAASGAASGTTLRGGIVTYLPEWPVNGASVMQRTATRRPSSHIARLSIGSIMNPPSSASDDDSPVPKSARPLETRSSIEIRSAMRAGWLNGGRRLHDAVTEPDALACAATRRRGTPRARSSASTPRGSGARPPTRSRCRASRRARSARARPGSAGTRSPSSHGRGSWCS